MTQIQKQALKMMAEKNIGAIVTRFGYTWPCDIRESEEKAAAVVARLEALNG